MVRLREQISSAGTPGVTNSAKHIAEAVVARRSASRAILPLLPTRWSVRGRDIRRPAGPWAKIPRRPELPTGAIGLTAQTIIP